MWDLGAQITLDELNKWSRLMGGDEKIMTDFHFWVNCSFQIPTHLQQLPNLLSIISNKEVT